MPDPLTLNCRNTADAQQQAHYHRINALAVALHGDRRPTYLTAQQPVPNGKPRTRAVGSVEVEALDEKKAELETRHWRLRRAINEGSVADIEAASRRVEEIERAITILQATIEDMDTSRGRPCHTPNLYRVTVPPICTLIAGQEFDNAPEYAYQLDTHALPEALHERLEAYLHSGTDAMPYWYWEARLKYRSNPRVPDDTFDLMNRLLLHLTATGEQSKALAKVCAAP